MFLSQLEGLILVLCLMLELPYCFFNVEYSKSIV
jgi:hypothetical protein